jgi:hypothetical protein
MPEATVNENGFSVAGKYNVGTTGKILHMKSESVAQPMEERTDSQLGSRVLASYAAH